MRWDIKPLVGAGPLLLGMTDSDVAKILNKTNPLEHRFVDPSDGSSREHRGIETVVCHYRNNILSGIDLSSHVSEVYFEEMKLFTIDAKLAMKLFGERNGGGARFGFGFVLFDRIAVSARGFYFGNKKFYPSDKNDWQDERGVGIYDDKEFVGPALEFFRSIRF